MSTQANNLFYKKPTTNCPSKQLFALDINLKGAKAFFFSTFEKLYKTIKKHKHNYFYEDNTYAKKVRLHIDIDEKISFETLVEKNLYGDKKLEIILNQIQMLLKEEYDIINPKTIILSTTNLNKISYHVIYPDIYFENVYDMGFFLSSINNIDLAIYRTGCFRTIHSRKKGKDNELVLHKTCNYDFVTDFQLFLDSMVCYCDNSINPLKVRKQDIIKKLSKKVKSRNALKKNKDYFYREVDFDVLKMVLKKLRKFADNYMDWLRVSFCLKDLYLHSNYKKKTVECFEYFSKFSQNYNQEQNKVIFMNIEPKLDINYLFVLAKHPHKIKKTINIDFFDHTKHLNVISENSQFINIDPSRLLRYKMIYIKGRCGVGKTTFLKKLLKHSHNVPLISITGRVNLAGEHLKNLDFVRNIQFYKNMSTNSVYQSKNLIIQLESLCKINKYNFNKGIVVLDEVNSLLQHFRSPTIKQRKQIFYLFSELIKNAKHVICLDADLCDWNIDFFKNIVDDEYIIYRNTSKPKKTNCIVYDDKNNLIASMKSNIKNNKYFVSCFDSLTEMKKIIKHIKNNSSIKNDDMLIYSSEIDYNIIETSEWINKYVFFTPSILYGIDFSACSVDVFTCITKSHLNPLNIYQMMSRARKKISIHLYCHNNYKQIKYNSVEDVVNETKCLEKLYSDFMEIPPNDPAYNIIYNNTTFCNSVLTGDLKNNLLNILIDKGYNLIYDKNKIKLKLEKEDKSINHKLIEILNFDKDNLNQTQLKLVTDDKYYCQFNNFKYYVKNIDLIEKNKKNIVIETYKSNNNKIILAIHLLRILEIYKLEKLTYFVTRRFNMEFHNKWLELNISIIKDLFDIRTNKYDKITYYNTYLLTITILKNLFGKDLFEQKRTKICGVGYRYYLIANELYDYYHSIIF